MALWRCYSIPVCLIGGIQVPERLPFSMTSILFLFQLRGSLFLFLPSFVKNYKILAVRSHGEISWVLPHGISPQFIILHGLDFITAQGHS